MFLIALAVLAASPTTFESAFAAAKPGDTIRLVAGRYPLTTIRSRTFNPPIKIDAAAATLTGMVFRDVSGVRWTGGVFDGSVLKVKSQTDYGIAAYGGTNLTVTGANFNALLAGIVFERIAGGEISNNGFMAMRSDGIDLVGSRSIMVAYNTCHNFNVEPGAHPDCVQSWSRPGEAPVADIQVIGNTAVGTMQGLSFFDGTLGGLPMGGYDRITISNNSVVTTQANGIAAYGCRGCVVRNNIVNSLPDYIYVAQLNAPGAVDVCGNTVVMVPRQGTPPCRN